MLSIITGSGKWVELTIAADPLYQHLLLVAEKKFYRGFELAVTAAYDAETAVERELVLRLASLLWRLRRATAVETGLLQIQCEMSAASDPAPSKLAGEVCDVIEIFQSRNDASGQALARCFLGLAGLDNGIFERLGRYEASLWRQVSQTIFILQHLQWGSPRGRYRRTLDRWQRPASRPLHGDE